MKIILDGRALADAVDLWLKEKGYKLCEPEVVFVSQRSLFGNDTFSAEVHADGGPHVGCYGSDQQIDKE